jgi:8-amino-3,8-dideoxy-alpha-D-manno-octulosonate transaminase
LSQAQQNALIALQHTDFSKSDMVMSKCISTAISLVWTEAQVHEKGAAFLDVLKKVLA